MSFVDRSVHGDARHLPAGLLDRAQLAATPVEIIAKPPVWIPNELSLDAYRAMFSGIGKRAGFNLGLLLFR